MGTKLGWEYNMNNCQNCNEKLHPPYDDEGEDYGELCKSHCPTCKTDICPKCGSINIGEAYKEGTEEYDDNEAEYWCNEKCLDCGYEGCRECI